MTATVRAATMADLDGMVDVELRAFDDAYGGEPSPELVASVRQIWAGRLGILGEWARVLETPADGIIGLLLCCPADPARYAQVRQHFQLDDDDLLRMVFGEPATAYVLNLAVVGSERHLAGSLRLFADLRARARRFSIRRLYFHSRVIGFAGWLADEFPDADPTALPPAERLRLAQRYSKSTMPNDNTRPLDRLLRMYVDRGCQVLGVTSGWSLDRLSLGYGVLCRRDLPPQPRSAPA